MSIKRICALLMAIVYCVLINNFYHEPDLTYLYRGVDSENNIMLLAAHFLSFAVIAFYIFGDAEKYLNGYGKYVLVRSKKRMHILDKIYIKAFLFVIIFEVIKILLYSIISGAVKTTFNSFAIMLVLSVLTNIFLISLQIFLELLFDSKSALTSIMMYFILSCALGGVLIKKNIYLPLIFLIPNYAMNQRTKYFINNLNLNHISIIMILIISITGFVIAGKAVLKRKDIF